MLKIELTLEIELLQLLTVQSFQLFVVELEAVEGGIEEEEEAELGCVDEDDGSGDEGNRKGKEVSEQKFKFKFRLQFEWSECVYDLPYFFFDLLYLHRSNLISFLAIHQSIIFFFLN